MSRNVQSNLHISRLIAHRGASDFAPENTLSALHKAAELGAKWVEFDVALTKDGVAVIFHDKKLKRTTGTRGLLADISYEDLQKLDAGSWFDLAFQGETVPTLAQWLQLAASLGMGVNLEMKVQGQVAATTLAECIAHEIKTHWSNDLPTPLISSFYPECLAAMQQLLVSAHFGFNIYRWQKNFMTYLDRFNCASLHVHFQSLTAARVAAVQATGRKVLAYTIDKVEIAKKLFAMGVDAIFSNNPLLLSDGALQ